ncbi:MAG: hypothetical protein K8U03_11940 [Planctomycetia bacterium]|nr:hypothetical protein [Planctomycetia bacterium]
MAETWLQANRRAFALPIAAAAVVAVACVIGAVSLGRRSETGTSTGFYVLLAAFSVALVGGVVLLLIARLPRISYHDGRVRFYVRFGPPVEVPLEHVEAFLLGRGPIFFTDDRTETKETTTLVVRIAEKAEEFSHVETAPLLAAWCGNFATLRGTWTEPLGVDLVNRLNQRLYDLKQAQAGAKGAT